MERRQIIEQELPRRKLYERSRVTPEQILLLALKNALNREQTAKQRIVVRRLITDAYREITLDF